MPSPSWSSVWLAGSQRDSAFNQESIHAWDQYTLCLTHYSLGWRLRKGLRSPEFPLPRSQWLHPPRGLQWPSSCPSSCRIRAPCSAPSAHCPPLPAHVTRYCHVCTCPPTLKRILKAKATAYLLLSLGSRMLYLAGGWHQGLFVPCINLLPPLCICCMVKGEPRSISLQETLSIWKSLCTQIFL